MPSTVTKPTSEPRESTPRRDQRARHAAHQREGQRQRRPERQAPRAEVRVEHQEDAEERSAAAKPEAGPRLRARPRTRRAARRGVRPGSAAARPRLARRGRPRRGRARATLQLTSMRREPPSCWITLGVGAMRTSATSPSRTVLPGPSRWRRSRSAARSARTLLAPTTPPRRALEARYTSPDALALDERRGRAGARPPRGPRPARASARGSTRTSIWGTSTCASTLRSTHPGRPRGSSRGSRRVRAASVRSGPKRRTTIAPLEPVSTSFTRSWR
jgi:hypothetical protein